MQQLPMLRSRLLPIAKCLTAALLFLVILSGCQTPSEKRGYSSLPQNRPAVWENQFNNINRH